MSNNGNFRYQSPSVQQPLADIFPNPIAAKRDPATFDIGYPIGQIWSNVLTSTVFVLASVAAGVATWTTIGGAGAGQFSSLTVTPGPISLTGTTTINTAGAAATSIGTGATGVVNIGNATGGTAIVGPTTVVGSFTQSGGNVSMSNDAVASVALFNTGAAAKTTGVGSANTTSTTTISGGTGGVVFNSPFLALPGPVYIYTGAGAPAGGLALHVGDIYINTTAGSAVTRMYIATAAGVWTNITCAA